MVFFEYVGIICRERKLNFCCWLWAQKLVHLFCHDLSFLVFFRVVDVVFHLSSTEEEKTKLVHMFSFQKNILQGLRKGARNIHIKWSLTQLLAVLVPMTHVVSCFHFASQPPRCWSGCNDVFKKSWICNITSWQVVGICFQSSFQIKMT